MDGEWSMMSAGGSGTCSPLLIKLKPSRSVTLQVSYPGCLISDLPRHPRADQGCFMSCINNIMLCTALSYRELSRPWLWPCPPLEPPINNTPRSRKPCTLSNSTRVTRGSVNSIQCSVIWYIPLIPQPISYISINT